MAQLVQILLTKELTVNLGKDKDGQQKTVTLPAGLQEVEAAIAEHWFVKAHAQEITANMVVNQELQEAYDALKTEHEALLEQLEIGSQKIAKLEAQSVADAKAVADLQAEIATMQTPKEQTKAK